MTAVPVPSVPLFFNRNAGGSGPGVRRREADLFGKASISNNGGFLIVLPGIKNRAAAPQHCISPSRPGEADMWPMLWKSQSFAYLLTPLSPEKVDNARSS